MGPGRGELTMLPPTPKCEPQSLQPDHPAWAPRAHPTCGPPPRSPTCSENPLMLPGGWERGATPLPTAPRVRRPGPGLSRAVWWPGLSIRLMRPPEMTQGPAGREPLGRARGLWQTLNRDQLCIRKQQDYERWKARPGIPVSQTHPHTRAHQCAHTHTLTLLPGRGRGNRWESGPAPAPRSSQKVPGLGAT